MKLNILPASQGYQWLRQANSIIQSNRLLLFSNIVLYIAAYIFASFISFGSQIILALLMGILSVIFSTTIMLICHRSLNPDLPEAAMTLAQLWAQAFRNKRILTLAFITALSLTLLFLLSNIIAEAIFPELFQKNQEILTQLESSQNSEISTDFYLSAMPYFVMQQACGIPAQVIVFLLFSMTPALIYWSSVSYGQAMFYNLIACLQNWRAWLAWFFAVLTIFALLPVTAIALLYALTQAGLSALAFATPIVLILIFGLMLLSMVIVPASYYFAYKDSFIQK